MIFVHSLCKCHPLVGRRVYSNAAENKRFLDLSLCLVTNRDGMQNEDLFINKAVQAVKGGVTCVQIRDKNEHIQDSIRTSLRLKKILKSFHVPLIIANRIDVALAVKADGVHLGQRDFPVFRAKKLLPKNAIIGLTVKTWEDVVAAEALDVNYLGIQIFSSKRTKPDNGPHFGLDGLKKVRQFSRHRLLAIGGIDDTNLQEIGKLLHPDIGHDGVAMVGELWRSKNPHDIAQKTKKILKHIQAKKLHD